MTTSASDEIADRLLDSLINQFSGRWHIEADEGGLRMRPRTPLAGGKPLRHAPHPRRVIDTMAQVFAAARVPRAAVLPIRWGRDTDLTMSAIQGLDPWLKDGADRVWREGFLPQPVVRFTGERDDQGRLRDGYLTSFVNLSCTHRISGPEHHAALLGTWLDALSAVGIHAGRVAIDGELATWHRGPVSGITLFLSCDGVGFADAVLLWNTADPSHMATDLGSGLERLCWLLSPQPWAHTVFGLAATWWDTDLLDAVRTATLLVMAGIRPGAHASGSALRRVLRRVPVPMAAAGLGRIIRAQRAYWVDTGMSGPGWPHLADVIENEILTAAARRSPQAKTTSP
ncbi:hypothetical protein F0L68_33530 [Solihabitans fulvus]|uniref:Uncharacterized protein n=1 Tax=Solihabitans fulvus TaxID=1892852 RepID=A0A5B2WRM2_9PSEU|nr:hypothetical protein [Solihabitans fulvus]KAA2253332.1 hypothetical protein F0L68_33530 [Solihabitans fulvus]